MTTPHLSIVIPAFNEAENVGPLVDEIRAAFADVDRVIEIVFVDDGSTDDTVARLTALMEDVPELRVVCLAPTGRGHGNGQSCAMRAGFHAARGAYVAGLDADRQNDPADLPDMLLLIEEQGVDLVQGDRSANRRDTLVKRVSSRIGRAARRLLLKDAVTDTGCSLRVMRAEVAQSIPLEYHGVHRFIPFLAGSLGYTVIETPVRHRERAAGETKYGIGNRALPGLIDCFAMRWIVNRRRTATISEVRRDTSVEDVMIGAETEATSDAPMVEVVVPARAGDRAAMTDSPS